MQLWYREAYLGIGLEYDVALEPQKLMSCEEFEQDLRFVEFHDVVRGMSESLFRSSETSRQ